MTKVDLLYKAQSLGLRVSKYATKSQILGVIEAHERFIRLNEMMKKR